MKELVAEVAGCDTSTVEIFLDAVRVFGNPRAFCRGAHKNVQALETDIRAWAKDWNEDPKPFIWTKSAEEILDSLPRFCRRISGAGLGSLGPVRSVRRQTCSVIRASSVGSISGGALRNILVSQVR